MTYRNGAHVPVRGWEAASLAKSAVAYNAGTLGRTRGAGVMHVEVFDGFECEWSRHQDRDNVNPSVRTVEEAAK